MGNKNSAAKNKNLPHCFNTLFCMLFLSLFILISLLVLNFKLPVKPAHALQQPQIINIEINNKRYPLILTEYKQSPIYSVNADLKKYGHGLTLIEKQQLVERFYAVCRDLETSINLVFPGLTKQADKILKQVNLKPTDAKIYFNPLYESFYVEDEHYGYGLSKEKFYQSLFLNLTQKEFSIIPNVLSPQVFARDLKKATYFRDGFETRFDERNLERRNNIILACKSLNGKVIKPGEAFSFNKTTGRRDSKHGYMEANIISGGVFKKGEGGGVCQVSSTLFNAGMLAGLTLIEAHPHSLPVSYVKKGADAMVNWQTSDLVFKNDTLFPIFLKAEVINNTIRIKFFGENLGAAYYEIETEILSELPEPKEKIITKQEADKKYPEIMEKFTTLPAYIRKGCKGYKTKTYLVTYTNGKVTGKKLIRQDTYKAYGAIIVEGTVLDSLQSTVYSL